MPALWKKFACKKIANIVAWRSYGWIDQKRNEKIVLGQIRVKPLPKKVSEQRETGNYQRFCFNKRLPKA